MTGRGRLDLRGVLTPLALVGGSLLVSLLLAEGAYRLIKPISTMVDHQPTIYQPDLAIGWRFIPNSSDYIERYEFRVPIHINSAGFFDDEFSLSHAPGVTRIAVLGDSFTAGFHVGRGRNYPDVLERQLNESGAAGCPCEVLNFGIPDTGIIQHARLLEETVLDYHPDIVIVGFYKNDVHDSRKEPKYKDTYRDYILAYRTEAQRAALIQQVDDLLDGKGALRFGYQHSYLVRALYNTWLESQGVPRPNLRGNAVSKGGGGQQYNLGQAYERIFESIEQMQSACREAGCELAFVMIPGKEEVQDGEAPLDGPVVEVLAERDIPTLELRETFVQHVAQGEALYWEYDGHANGAGYRLIGVELAAFLRREGLLADSYAN